ncbi:MAG: HAD-IA family hydrolase [Proteobacteria bacterium]|nr:HAD-IA family hydrolase [Pseudomonadota bacterium]
MKTAAASACLLLDIGGVLLTDGWDHLARKRAARTFRLDWTEMEERHRLVFETYEEGKFTLAEYLDRVVFYRKRMFKRVQFQRFMYGQSKPYPAMIELIARIKARHRLKVAVISNEGRELNAYRIRKFKLDHIVDFFVCSSLVHLRKPDAQIFRLALDVAQVQARRAVYIDDTPMFAEIGRDLGMRSVFHTSYRSTRAQLSALGLSSE